MPDTVQAKRRAAILLRWLALSLLGGLLYALVKALWATIQIGSPTFDWQWYLALILLLGGFSTHLIWRWPPPRPSRVLLALLLLWAIGGYGGLGKTLLLRPAQSPPIPVSFWSPLKISQFPDELLKDRKQDADDDDHLAVGEQLAGRFLHGVPDLLKDLPGPFLSVDFGQDAPGPVIVSF